MHQRLGLRVLQVKPGVWQHREIAEAEIKVCSIFSMRPSLHTNTHHPNTKPPLERGNMKRVGVGEREAFSLTHLALPKEGGGGGGGMVWSHTKGVPVLQRVDDELALRDMLLRSIQR